MGLTQFREHIAAQMDHEFPRVHVNDVNYPPMSESSSYTNWLEKDRYSRFYA